jgi:hypothetical protein
MSDTDTLTAIRRIQQSQKLQIEKAKEQQQRDAAIQQERKKRMSALRPAGGLFGGINSGGFKLKSKGPPVQPKIQFAPRTQGGLKMNKILNDWVPPKFNRMTGRNVELRIIDQEASLLPLLDYIEEAKQTDPALTDDDILIAFDMDGTLKHVVNADNIRNGDSLRGGRDSRTFFRVMKDRQIKWIVISAKAGVRYMKNSTAKNLFETLKFTEDDIGVLSTGCRGTNPISKSADYSPIKGEYVANGKKYKTVRCNNLFNGYDANEGDDEPIGNEKDIVLEYAITQICSTYPKLIIFVDDNAENVMTVYNHYKSTPMRVICALYPPFTKEETHDMAYAHMTQQMGKFQ